MPVLYAYLCVFCTHIYIHASKRHIYMRLKFLVNKTPAKAFTPPAESKMGTRPGRAVTREFIERGVYSLISVLPN